MRRSAGPITIRTSVASINTATANVNPIILTTRKLPKVNAANTTIMIEAALVIRPAVLANPSGIASASIEDLPRVDDVLVSHSHYDHLDLPSVRALGKDVRYWTPEGLSQWFRRRGIRDCSELSW